MTDNCDSIAKIARIENERNSKHHTLWTDIVKEVVDNCDGVICGHHIVYQTTVKAGGFDCTVVQELPSADALIFDHGIARKLWGDDCKSVLTQLACEPAETRDDLLASLYYGRPH